MTTRMQNLEAIVKFRKGTDKKGHGFFMAPGLPDIHVLPPELHKWGFVLSDMQPGQPALVDATLDQVNGEMKISLDKIHSIGDKLAQEAPAEAEPAKPVSPKTVETGPAPDIEFDEGKPQRRIGVVREGDIVRASFKCGFNGDGEKMSNFGFFIPHDRRFGGKDVFVHGNSLPNDFDELLAGGVDFSVTITEIKGGRYNGRVNGRWIETSELPNTDTSAMSEKQKRKEEQIARSEARRAAIMARKNIVVTDGERTLEGRPVTDDWGSLDVGTKCVLVDFFDEKTGQIGEVQLHFVVQKPGGTPKMASAVEVWIPEALQADQPKVLIAPKSTGLFLVNGVTLSAPVFAIEENGDAAKIAFLVRKGVYPRVAIRDRKGSYTLGEVQKGQTRLRRIDASLVNMIKQPQMA